MEGLIIQGLEKFLFEHDWIDTDVVALLEDEDITHTRNDKEITHDTEN